MPEELLYLILADAILIIHFLFVIFVVLGLVFIYVGKYQNWSWIRNARFRWLHLLSVGVVVIQPWLGILCPLTVWEMKIRERAGDAVYSGSFIAHWLESILYYRAPDWIFMMVYTAFGVLVVGSWFFVSPRQR